VYVIERDKEKKPWLRKTEILPHISTLQRTLQHILQQCVYVCVCRERERGCVCVCVCVCGRERQVERDWSEETEISQRINTLQPTLQHAATVRVCVCLSRESVCVFVHIW